VPFKNKKKRNSYFKNYMRERRANQKTVKPVVKPVKPVYGVAPFKPRMIRDFEHILDFMICAYGMARSNLKDKMSEKKKKKQEEELESILDGLCRMCCQFSDKIHNDTGSGTW